MLRHEVDYRFRGPLGGFAAASLNAVGGAQMGLRHGVLAQKAEIERGSARTLLVHPPPAQLEAPHQPPGDQAEQPGHRDRQPQRGADLDERE